MGHELYVNILPRVVPLSVVVLANDNNEIDKDIHQLLLRHLSERERHLQHDDNTFFMGRHSTAAEAQGDPPAWRDS